MPIGPVNVPAKLKSLALPIPEIRGGSYVANPKSGGRGGHRVGDGTVRKSVGEFYAVHP